MLPNDSQPLRFLRYKNSPDSENLQWPQAHIKTLAQTPPDALAETFANALAETRAKPLVKPLPKTRRSTESPAAPLGGTYPRTQATRKMTTYTTQTTPQVTT
ncbi:hypothetical protein J3459_014698 [Metarhizium acridum]|uniref:uncharacterized protein n=1 Tax=Metarhizium acridum TaxID=92637 RepID=UPI001C6C5769|nr:hypothetical protein J3458_014461 [Metarhizium acridum]KAG8414504.1 hypothetical protein J3459_014698 [Metarhizium acridum]